MRRHQIYFYRYHNTITVLPMIPIHFGSCPDRPQSFSVRPSPNSVPSAQAPDRTGYETPRGNAFQRAGWRHTGFQWLATISSLPVLFLVAVLANLTIVTSGIAGGGAA